MGKKRVTFFWFSSTFSRSRPLDHTESQESIPRALTAPSAGYSSLRGSCMPCRPSLVTWGTDDPRYNTRQRQIGVGSAPPRLAIFMISASLETSLNSQEKIHATHGFDLDLEALRHATGYSPPSSTLVHTA